MQEHPVFSRREATTLSARVWRFFRDREVILRSEGRIRYIRLRRPLLVGLAGFSAGLVLWAGAATTTAWYTTEIARQKSADITEIRASFQQLQEELSGYRDEINAIAMGTEEPGVSGQTMTDPETAVRRISNRLTMSLDRLALDVRAVDQVDDGMIATREALYEEIASLRRQIDAGTEREASLATEISALRSERDMLRADGDALALQNQRLEASRLVHQRQADEMRAMIETLRTARNAVQAKLSDAVAALEQHRSDSNSRISELRADRAKLTQDIAVLEDRIAGMQRAAAQRNDNLARLIDVLHGLGREANRQSLQSSGDKSLEVKLEFAVADVADDLRESRRRRAEIEQTLVQVVEGLSDVAGRPVAQPSPQAPDPVAAARNLLAEIETLHNTQNTVVADLIERTDNGIRNLNAMFDRAGLTGDLLAELGIKQAVTAQGGPFADYELAGGSADALMDNVAVLNDRAALWSSLESVMACIPWVSPVDYFQLTSEFGKRRDPINGRMAMHEGVDLAAWPRTPVYAASPGVVTFAGKKNGYGNIVEIDHGCGVVTRHAHLRSIDVKTGDTVAHRDMIGRIGSTGRSTGPHIHYEILINGTPIDPMKVIDAGRFAFRG